VYLRGTMPTQNLLQVLPELDRLGLNVKVVAAVSPQLFRMQSLDYRDSVVGPADRIDAMVITNGAFNMMHDWPGGRSRASSPFRGLGRSVADRWDYRRSHR